MGIRRSRSRWRRAVYRNGGLLFVAAVLAGGCRSGGFDGPRDAALSLVPERAQLLASSESGCDPLRFSPDCAEAEFILGDAGPELCAPTESRVEAVKDVAGKHDWDLKQERHLPGGVTLTFRGSGYSAYVAIGNETRGKIDGCYDHIVINKT